MFTSSGRDCLFLQLRNAIIEAVFFSGGSAVKFLFGFLAAVLSVAMLALFGFRCKTDKTVRRWKRKRGSFVILCAHPSEIDAVALLCSLFPRFARIVAGKQQLYRGPRGALFRKLGCIGKTQFCPDLSAVREMFDTVRDGHILAMMPEGRVSMDGTASPIDLPTAKLLQKLKVPVAVLIPHGSYFIKPPYDNRSVILGPMRAELRALYTAEEVVSLSAEELLAGVNEALAYDESAFTRARRFRYGLLKREPKRNISHLFYRCPVCGDLYTVGDAGKLLRCSACGTEWKLSPRSFFPVNAATLPEGTDVTPPDDIRRWNLTQLAFEDEFWADPAAAFTEEVKKAVMIMGGSDDFAPAGGGTLSLTHEGFRYRDDSEEIFLPLAGIAGFSADYLRGDIVLYRGELLTRFIFDDPRKVARLMNALAALKKQ